MKICVVINILLWGFFLTVSAQTNDTIGGESHAVVSSESDTVPLSKQELKRQRLAQRNLHYNIIGGPSYTPDFGVLIGGSALMTFRINREDLTQQRSVVPIAIALMFKGGLNLVTKPQLFFNHDRFRIFGVFSYKNTTENFYGIGYNTNKDYPRGKSTSEYRYSGLQVNPWLMFRLGKSNFFAGPQIDLYYDKITKPAEGIVDSPSYIDAGGTEQGYTNFSSGIGFLLTYDTRDVPSNAYQGAYIDFRGMMYSKVLGSDSNFYRLELDYRQYKSVGNRRVLAWTVQSKNVFGDIPLTKYVLSGTAYDLRGYYMGQFCDKSSHIAMLEYRQMWNIEKSNKIRKVLSHIGYVAWGGCGFMGPTPGKIEGVLPNLGLGMRIEIQPRMNLRLDLGRDMVNKQNLFYFNMTEAF